MPQVLKSGIIFRPHPSETPHKSGIPSGLYGAAILYDWLEERLDVVRRQPCLCLVQCAYQAATLKQRIKLLLHELLQH